MSQTTGISSLSESQFRLGDWLVDPNLGRIFRGDTTVHLRRASQDLKRWSHNFIT